MDQEFKAKWIAALRSGKYKQGRLCLRNEGNYCCLGVLSDLAADEKVCEWYDDKCNGFKVVLPPCVANWAHCTQEPRIVFDQPLREGHSWITLSELNDQGFSFSQIADVIEYFL